MRTPPQILIVDDNPANLDIFETRLAAHGYDIITASDGAAGLALAMERKPDLILLDVMMPKMDGIEVCQRLKGDPALPFIPIILVTAKAEAADVVAGLEAGGDEYLTKPVDQKALVARVKSMLRIKQLHDTTQDQARRIEADAARLAEWNESLKKQVAELERVGQLEALFLAADRRCHRLFRVGRLDGPATAAKSPWCFAICVVSRPSRRLRNMRM